MAREIHHYRRLHRTEDIARTALAWFERFHLSHAVGVLDRLIAGGIENVIALRGDPPQGQTRFEVPADGFAHASDLVAFIRRRHGDRQTPLR